MKRFFLAVVIICAFFPFTACKTLNSSFQEPVVSLYSVETADININNAQFLCKIQVKNPNAYEIPFPQTGWELFIKEKSYKDGTVTVDGKIKARSAVFIEVPVKIEYLDFFKTFKPLIGSKQASYKLTMAVKYSSPDFGEKVWNFDNSGELPLPQLPLLSAPAIVIESVDFSKVEILVSINVENPNVFEIPSPKFSYDYILNKKSFIWGIIEDETPLAPTSVTPVKFRMVVNYADLFRTYSSFSFTRETSSLLVLTCDFRIPVFSGESRRFEVPGVFPIRR